MLIRQPVKMELFSFPAIQSDGSVEKSTRAGFKNGKPIALEPPPPPVYGENDLNTARQEAFQQGYLQGMEEGQRTANTAQAQVNDKLGELLQHMVGQVAESLQSHHQLMEQKKAELPKLALLIARKVAGDALQDNQTLAIEQLVHQCFSLAAGDAKLVITVHESLASALEERLIHAFSGNDDAGEIIISPDPNMGLQDCRIEWKDGSAERNVKEIWAEIERILGIAPEEPVNP